MTIKDHVKNMKTKSFHDLIRKRLTDEEIAEITKQAQIEVDFLKTIQKILSDTMAKYMKENNFSFNEVVHHLAISPYKAAKIKRGEANITLANFAYFLTLMGKEAKDIFKV